MEFNHSLNEIILANCVIFLAAMVQTSAGMGFGMIAVPLLALISLDYVPGASLFINLFIALFMLQDGRSKVKREEITILLPLIAVGTIVAVIILLWIPAAKLNILFSIIILIAVAITIFVKNSGLNKKKLTIGGFTAGLMGTVSGIHGSPLAVLYQHEDIEKTRATLAVVFLYAYTLSLIGLTYTGAFGLQLALEGLLLLPGLIFGFIFAKQVRDFISKTVARYLMLTISAIGAIALLIKAM